jgi:hypothetical protein
MRPTGYHQNAKIEIFLDPLLANSSFLLTNLDFLEITKSLKKHHFWLQNRSKNDKILFGRSENAKNSKISTETLV